MRTTSLKALKQLNPCKESLLWIEQNEGSSQDLWNKCTRAGWMLWLLAKTDADHKQMVLCACEIATAKAYGSKETEKLAEYADIVRKYFPECPV